ncbi:MAG: ribonucleoside triphosphate reductase [Candidatus Pacebacteria bacterium]|nr:ribonucleoside triphosphate reductase [Candidatus Paceibacterota bacterium]
MAGRRSLDFVSLVDGYLAQKGWKAKNNSNSDYSLSELILHTAGSVLGNYALSQIYSPAIKKAHEEGLLHLHDLTHSVVGYCAGWSLENLLARGYGGVSGQIETLPARHFSTAIQHVIYFIKAMYQEWAGAQAFSSFDTFLAPFVYFDHLSYDEVYQEIQKLIFSLNLPSKWGFERPFSNLTFDWVIPSDLAKKRVIIGGRQQKEKYWQFQKEAGMINRAFLEVMLKGDKSSRPFTFPIPTYNLTREFFKKENGNSRLLFRVTAKYGLPYFQNYIGSGLDPNSVRAMCCRLNMDLKQLISQPGNLWAKGDSTGSIGVVTINLNRLACQAKDRKDFFSGLKKTLKLAKEALEIKRKIVEKNLKQGLMPYSRYYLGSFRNHFSTIGVCGGNEACLNLLGKSIATEAGQKFAQETLEFIKEELVKFQEETGYLYNLEATPAESTAYRMALLDQKKFPKAKLAGTKKSPYLTNSTQLPVDETDDLWEALQLQENLQATYTGGTVFHVFLGEELSDWRSCRTLVKKIAEKTKLPYFSITPTFSVCKNCGRLKGKVFICPRCGEETEVYSRIVGYLRPLRRWNKGKAQEFKERKTYQVV